MSGFTFPLILSQARLPLDPQEYILGLSSACENLGVSSQDVYGDFNCSENSSWLKLFESSVSKILQKYDSLFVPSGVMAQNIVLAIAQSKSYPIGISKDHFLCHFSSHILLHENNAFSELLRMNAVIISEDNNAMVQKPVTYNDVLPFLESEILPCVLLIECPHREIGGKCIPWEDLVAISSLCRKKGVLLHMDGARLWEAVAYYDRDISEICALFDSVYVSFYKGLGAITGAMLIGNKDFIIESKKWLRRFGGNLFCQLPYAVSCWKGLIDNRHSFTERLTKLKDVIKVLSELFINDNYDIIDPVTNDKIQLLRFDPPVPEVSLIHVYIFGSQDLIQLANENTFGSTGIKIFTRIIDGKFGMTKTFSTFEFNMVEII